MTTFSEDTCRILVPSGVLGSGCPEEAFQRGLSLGPHAIALDAGSTDSGPYYLGSGTSKMTDAAIQRDLLQMIPAQLERGIPLIIGSCGTCGSNQGVDNVATICRSILKELGLSARIAKIYSEQEPAEIETYLKRGAVAPLAPMKDLSVETIRACRRIVALAGHIPFVKALEAGADIVLAGRATDTAVISAFALMHGFPPAPAWHAAKIAECGGICTEDVQLGGVMIDIDAGGFTVEPLHKENRCTPRSVSAHMLYENSDPFKLVEPGIVLHVNEAVYTALDERRVRVTGATAQETAPTIKLEGARHAGYQTVSFVGIADPGLLANIDSWIEALSIHARKRIAGVLGYTVGDYDIDFRPYGAGALNPLPAGTVPAEVGLMVVVTAETQEKASEILKLCNPLLLHFPYKRNAPLPSFAFPYSPAEIERGPVYEFCLNHVVEVNEPGELHRMVIEEAGQ
ncbi:hypothetical protein HAD_10240 [Hyphomonas adhaerens MHS-3]|uniref:Acyclic terpene utilisation N-terminal domain-containing protein n=2 Tax=Hyphomonas adhaerens TaxID=81029 RepID=A0A069E7V6_9PROT|nr:hypothetical protein HAD_10240 [Hyphomonas adhaerens MHS-3]